MSSCPKCGSEMAPRKAFSGSPNMSWLECRACGHMEPVFVDEADWQEWDMPVKFVDGCMVVPFELLKRM